MAYKRIGDMLVAGGYLTEEKLKTGLAESRRTGKKLGETLVEMGFIRQSDLINVLENQLDVEYMYSLFTHKEGKAYMVFRISDEERFNAVLAANGVPTADKDELGLK